MTCLFFEMKMFLINIAIPNTGRKLFTYKCNEIFYQNLKPGQRVIVPFGRRKLSGYFIEKAKSTPTQKLREIIDIVDKSPLFDKNLYRFLLWMSEYYYAGIGDTLNAAIPPNLRRLKRPYYVPSSGFNTLMDEYHLPEKSQKKIEKAGKLTTRDITFLNKSEPGLLEKLLDAEVLKESWVENNKENIIRSAQEKPDIFSYFKPRADVSNIKSNIEQTIAIKTLGENLGGFTPWLLYGITGSGKTLVYCHVASEVIKNGGTVLVLVPEIALAGTLLSYFKSFFGENIALLHSALKPKERLLVWQNIKSGQYKIVIGARSAIFAPLENLGLIVIDEEHDESYKQDDPSPRFQARDAAVMRAKISDIPIVLGTATPSLESFSNAQNGRYKMLKLTQRPEKTKLPITRLIDLKEERSAGKIR